MSDSVQWWTAKKKKYYSNKRDTWVECFHSITFLYMKIGPQEYIAPSVYKII